MNTDNSAKDIESILDGTFDILSFYKGPLGLVASVRSLELLDIALFARDDENLRFDFLNHYTAVDHPPQSLEVFVQLFSFTYRHKLTLKCRLDRSDPRIPSLSSIWPASNWYEREMYDLFGIVFTGHVELKRLFMPANWVGHPLRKDYEDSRILPLPEVLDE